MTTHIAVISDTHINSTVSLCPPRINLDDGGEYRPSKGQRWLWDKWASLWDSLHDLVGKRYLVLLGDVGELDTKRRSNQLITPNKATIQSLVLDTLKPALDWVGSEGVIVVIRGTAAHVGKSSWLEQWLGADVKAYPASDGVYSHWHLRADFDGVRFDLAHHAGMGGLTTLRLGDHTAVTGDIASLAGLPLVYLRLSGAAVHGDVADIAGLTSLTTLDIHSNLNDGGITGDLANFAGMTSLVYLSFGQTLITGDIGDLSGLTTIQTLFCYNNGSITGNTSDLAAMANLIYCYTYGTSIIPDTIADNTKIRELRVQDSGLSQAQVDALLAHIYTNRATFASTVSPIILRIEADNAAPSGIYQDGDPPTTGLEYVYELANDPETEGFKPWAITWNGGSAP